MNIREQLSILGTLGAEFVVVGGQAGVLRQAIEHPSRLSALLARVPLALPESGYEVRQDREGRRTLSPSVRGQLIHIRVLCSLFHISICSCFHISIGARNRFHYLHAGP
jgi:uncharacterized protein YqjF (DUF2071 family)